jgi:hypothetical protein
MCASEWDNGECEIKVVNAVTWWRYFNRDPENVQPRSAECSMADLQWLAFPPLKNNVSSSQTTQCNPRKSYLLSD